MRRETMLADIAAGNLRVAFGLYEPDARYDLRPHTLSAVPDRGGFVLNGAKAIVLGGRADRVILAARGSGRADDETGISLFCLPGDVPGLEVEEFPTLDGQRSAQVQCKSVHVDADGLIGQPGQGFPLLAEAVDRMIAALCAEAVGVMSRLFEMTLEHLKTRKQFGQPLGSFQALQHRAVDLLTLLERSRSMALYATSRAADPNRIVRASAVSAAKAFIGRAGRRLIKEAIQLHGGLGMTDELPVSHYVKRLLSIDLTLGDAAHHTAAFAEMAQVEERGGESSAIARSR